MPRLAPEIWIRIALFAGNVHTISCLNQELARMPTSKYTLPRMLALRMGDADDLVSIREMWTGSHEFTWDLADSLDRFLTPRKGRGILYQQRGWWNQRTFHTLHIMYRLPSVHIKLWRKDNLGALALMY